MMCTVLSFFYCFWVLHPTAILFGLPLVPCVGFLIRVHFFLPVADFVSTFVFMSPIKPNNTRAAQHASSSQSGHSSLSVRTGSPRGAARAASHARRARSCPINGHLAMFLSAGLCFT